MSLIYNDKGSLHSNISDVIAADTNQLVMDVLDKLNSPALLDELSQFVLLQSIVSRLSTTLITESIRRNIAVGQGSSKPVTKTPLEILDEDIGIAFEKAERGAWDGEHAHDMLQVFSGMLDSAKKSESYFKDWDDDEDDDEYSIYSEGDGEYPYGANAR